MDKLDLASVATLFIVGVALVVGFIGVAKGQSPWPLVFPTFAGAYAIMTIRR